MGAKRSPRRASCTLGSWWNVRPQWLWMKPMKRKQCGRRNLDYQLAHKIQIGRCCSSWYHPCWVWWFYLAMFQEKSKRWWFIVTYRLGHRWRPCPGPFKCYSTPANWSYSPVKSHEIGSFEHEIPLNLILIYYFFNPFSYKDMAWHDMFLRELPWNDASSPGHGPDSKALCIDVVQMGVGGIDSWGNKPLAEHMIGAQQEATWAFQLLPGKVGDGKFECRWTNMGGGETYHLFIRKLIFTNDHLPK